MAQHTQLDVFLTHHQLTTVQVAHLAHMSRKHVGNVRHGKAEPGLHCMSAILRACRRLTNNSDICIEDLFDVSVQRNGTR